MLIRHLREACLSVPGIPGPSWTCVVSLQEEVDWEGQGGQEGSAAIQDKAPELGQLLQGPGGSEWELALGRLQCGKGEPAWGPLSTPGRG